MVCMKLETYLKTNGLTDEAFAALVDLSQSQISRIKRDKSWPTRDVMERIAKVTNGAVTANDFIEIELTPKRRAPKPKQAEAAQ